MRLLRTDGDEVNDDEAEEEKDVRAIERAARRDDVIRYCLGDPEAAARDGLHEILSDMGR